MWGGFAADLCELLLDSLGRRGHGGGGCQSTAPPTQLHAARMHDVTVTWPGRRAVRLLRRSREEFEALPGHEGVWPLHDVHSAVSHRLERKTKYASVLPTSQRGGAGVLVLRCDTGIARRCTSDVDQACQKITLAGKKIMDFRGVQDS